MMRVHVLWSPPCARMPLAGFVGFLVFVCEVDSALVPCAGVRWLCAGVGGAHIRARPHSPFHRVPGPPNVAYAHLHELRDMVMIYDI